MCGICGRLELGESAIASPQIVREMCDRLAHRGPDDARVWHQGPVALGHRRLSIIDLAGGRQPIENETGTARVVCNGEIYNFRELRRDLEARGHHFRTGSDTEAILHGYEEWGLDVLERLDGMFAFALWDASRSRLFLGRDRLGIKPLFYTHVPRRFIAFASELRALCAVPEIALRPDPVAIDQFLSLQYVPAPRTGIEGVWKLPPAHGLVVEDSGDLRIWEYWDPASVEPTSLSRVEAARALHETLGAAVRSHLVSDVPVASFLSGGVDSGVVTALMAEAQDGDVSAITIGFRDARVDERPLARLIAGRYGCIHHERVLDADVGETLARVLLHLDEPLADWSALPTFLVSEAAHEQGKVVLSGDGGDELFGGYARHRVQRAESLVRMVSERLPPAWLGAAVACWPRSAPGRASIGNLALGRVQSLARKHAHGFFADADGRGAVYGPWLRDSLPAADERLERYVEPFARHYERIRHRDPVTAALYIELRTYLVDDILTKVDRMSMAHALEVRVPFLDHRVVELALSLPPAWKVGWTRGKRIFREAFRPLLTPAHWSTPKRGFDIPAAAWLRGPLKNAAEELLLGDRTRQRGVLDSGRVGALWAEHQQRITDHARRLWALMMLEGWLRNMETWRQRAGSRGVA